MRNAEQLDIAVETPSSKIHGSDFRSAARQRRLVSTMLSASLLPLMFMVFLIYTGSNKSSDVTELFDEYPPPVPHNYLADRVCSLLRFVILIYNLGQYFECTFDLFLHF